MKKSILNISVFNGGWNLPIWAALEQNFFSQNEIHLNINYTKSSADMIAGFYSGTYPIIFCSADNIIAYQANCAEIPIDGEPDARIFLGGDAGFLMATSTPEINTISQLKSGTIGVDKRDTGFAYVLYDILSKNNLTISDVKIEEIGSTDGRLKALVDGRCLATLLRTPYQLLAKSKGCNLFSQYQMTVYDYQGTVGAVRTRWLKNNENTLFAFKRAYRQGLEWIHSHQSEAKSLLEVYIPELSPPILDEAFASLLDEKYGLDLSMTPNRSGLEGALSLRNKFRGLIAGRPQINLDFDQIVI
jgi:ABC-type nitrate/sulfonate/bicarbonate transport system substrate-binding protein